MGVRFGDAKTKNADSDPVTAPMVARRARLKPEDFKDFDYTVRCPGCDQLLIGGTLRRNITEVVRDRSEDELGKTDHGKDRLGRAKDRLDAKTTKMMEDMIDGPSNPKDVSNQEEKDEPDMFFDHIQGDLPTASTDLGEETWLKDVPSGDSDRRIPTGTREIYIGTPDRPRMEKRRVDPDEVDGDIKARRVYVETEEGDAMSILGSPDDQPDTKLRRYR